MKRMLTEKFGYWYVSGGGWGYFSPLIPMERRPMESQVEAEIGPDTRLARNPNIVLREEEDNCGLLFDPDSGDVRVLNGSAMAIWKLLDGKRDLRAVTESLRELFTEVDAGVETQVLSAVREFILFGAVTVDTSRKVS
jgi:hypothetical protein